MFSSELLDRYFRVREEWTYNFVDIDKPFSSKDKWRSTWITDLSDVLYGSSPCAPYYSESVVVNAVASDQDVDCSFLDELI